MPCIAVMNVEDLIGFGTDVEPEFIEDSFIGEMGMWRKVISLNGTAESLNVSGTCKALHHTSVFYYDLVSRFRLIILVLSDKLCFKKIKNS